MISIKHQDLNEIAAYLNFSETLYEVFDMEFEEEISEDIANAMIFDLMEAAGIKIKDKEFLKSSLEYFRNEDYHELEGQPEMSMECPDLAPILSKYGY